MEEAEQAERLELARDEQSDLVTADEEVAGFR